MFIDFKNTNKKERTIIENALWFAKNKLLPRHKIDEIEIEMIKNFDIDADCYDTDDRSFNIRIKKGLSVEDLQTAVFHEFTHIKQHVKKEYDLFAINNNNVAYLDRPYEKEAFILQEELLNEYTTTT
jgi:hypothetical protein